MSNFTINPKYITKTDDKIIEVIRKEINPGESIYSIKERKEYKIDRITSTYIKYTGKDRNKGKPEDISFENIKILLTTLKILKEFNTNSSILKEEIPRAIYKKRSPLFAILFAAEIIIKK